MSSLFGPDRDDLDETDSGDATGAGDRERRGRDRRLLRWVVVVVLAVVAAVYLVGYAFAGDRLPQGTKIAGVDVGGRQPDGARSELARELRPLLDDPVEVVVDERTFTVDPEAAGLDVDVAASVAQVPVGRSWNPADMWENLVGGGEYDAVVVTIDDLLSDRLEEIAEEVEEPAVEGGVRFTPQGAEPTYPEDGAVLDVDGAAAAVTAAYPSGGEPVELDLAVDGPEVSSEEVSRAMKEFANPAMSAPVTYTVGGERVVLEPSRYARALSMRAVDGELVPEVDTKALRKVFRPAMVTLGSVPATRPWRSSTGGRGSSPPRRASPSTGTAWRRRSRGWSRRRKGGASSRSRPPSSSPAGPPRTSASWASSRRSRSSRPTTPTPTTATPTSAGARS